MASRSLLGHGGGGATTLRVYTAWTSEADQRLLADVSDNPSLTAKEALAAASVQAGVLDLPAQPPACQSTGAPAIEWVADKATLLGEKRSSNRM